jgi:raffinose/stachyose/melibiose transport system permease protein
MASKRMSKSAYPKSLLLPSGALYILFFLIPTVISLFFSLTRWNLQSWKFIGLENYRTYFDNPNLRVGFLNTLLYGIATSAIKVVVGLLLANFLTTRLRSRGFLRSTIFFPTLISTVGIGLTFKVLLDPFHGPVNAGITSAAHWFGLTTYGPGWLTDSNFLPLFTIVLTDVWKGVGFATLIYIAGIATIPRDYYEAAAVDGASNRRQFFAITLPLIRPAMFSVILLSFIGGLRSFDLIWSMTGGGPGFVSDVMASINYKQYQAGFYGISTAGNVILLVFVSALVIPLTRFLNRRELDN